MITLIDLSLTETRGSAGDRTQRAAVGDLAQRVRETLRFGKASGRSRGPQWLSATRAESAIRRPFRSPNKTRRSQTGLEQWIVLYWFKDTS